MNVIWIFLSLFLNVLAIIISVLISSRTFDTFPAIQTVDNTLIQLQLSNVAIVNDITSKQLTLTDINNNITSLQNFIVVLQSNLDAALLAATTQNVAPPPAPVFDPEILLLADLRTNLLNYMTPNIVLGTTYLKNSTFYQGIDALILTYLGQTQLTLSQALTHFTDLNTLNFRQAIDIIYNNILPYNFDSFYTDLLTPP